DTLAKELKTRAERVRRTVFIMMLLGNIDRAFALVCKFHYTHRRLSPNRACAEFCVIGLLAGDCRLVRRHHEHEEARSTRSAAEQPVGGVSETRGPDWRERAAQAADQAAGREGARCGAGRTPWS